MIITQLLSLKSRDAREGKREKPQAIYESSYYSYLNIAIEVSLNPNDRPLYNYPPSILSNYFPSVGREYFCEWTNYFPPPF